MKAGLVIVAVVSVVATLLGMVAFAASSFDSFDILAAQKTAPFPRITKGEIHLYPDKVVIDVKDPQWATFEGSKSMAPVFDQGHYAIEVAPQSMQDIHVGDIISYESQYATGTLVHRVVELGQDDGSGTRDTRDGWYAIAKGDNNPTPDPGKIRFSQIKRVMAVVIY